MGKQIMQFRYYKDGDREKNQPRHISKARLKTGDIFSNFYPITKLTIQTLPNNKFYLNKSIYPIIVGPTGIFEVNLENIAEIHSLTFEEQSINNIQLDDDGYLIIDIIYEE